MKQVEILGIPITNIDHNTLVERMKLHIDNGEKSFVITANPEIVMRAKEDPYYRECIRSASYITADGIGIVKASRLMKNPLPERVTGYDLMIDFLQISHDRNYKIFLLGAHDDVLAKTVANIQDYYTNIQVVGSHHGFFDWDDHETAEVIAQKIEAAQPDLVFVALGAPKQEQWIAENWDRFDKGVFLCVGGSFDVLSGTVKRAPLKWQENNIEWLYRLFQKPSRWRRMSSLPRFAYHVIREKLNRRSS
ncbi:WecB/TagA/CpsF family glycosyltransferase [Thalassobacillus sp. CUG 92003]|uniref:WecB/TagA/CpsF family glycosyltransferase n=1 Tax=Thalassobacillus sp. CUG 92003 TaxID=2736641 RepID=UPI0015E7B86B|nr:WecB/TagA/CpsF family glycosyltransferase [Thalassobacillus sp. CUG 92003]